MGLVEWGGVSVVGGWVVRLCSALWWFDRVSNKPSVKADLAIYSYVLGVSM